MTFSQCQQKLKVASAEENDLLFPIPQSSVSYSDFAGDCGSLHQKGATFELFHLHDCMPAPPHNLTIEGNFPLAVLYLQA